MSPQLIMMGYKKCYMNIICQPWIWLNLHTDLALNISDILVRRFEFWKQWWLFSTSNLSCVSFFQFFLLLLLLLSLLLLLLLLLLLFFLSWKWHVQIQVCDNLCQAKVMSLFSTGLEVKWYMKLGSKTIVVNEQQ